MEWVFRIINQATYFTDTEAAENLINNQPKDEGIKTDSSWKFLCE